MEYCEKHELSNCGVCHPPPKAKYPRKGIWFVAKYGGQCYECGEWYQVRDRIRATGEGGYLCSGCG